MNYKGKTPFRELILKNEHKNMAKNAISFEINSEPIMLLSKGKFFWKGKEVKDIHKVYERFNEWLTKAENNKLTK